MHANSSQQHRLTNSQQQISNYISSLRSVNEFNELESYANPIKIGSVQKHPKVNKQPSITPVSNDHESNELGCHANPIVESGHQSISNSNDRVRNIINQSLVASKIDKQIQDYRSKQGIEYAYLLSLD